ncbi:hypothetical protein D3C75_1099900 [compost metagenome]
MPGFDCRFALGNAFEDHPFQTLGAQGGFRLKNEPNQLRFRRFDTRQRWRDKCQGLGVLGDVFDGHVHQGECGISVGY